MTEKEMFEKSFQRPRNYFDLSDSEQWRIDDELGILDWRGSDISAEDFQRFCDYYKNI